MRLINGCPFCGSGNTYVSWDYIYEIPKEFAVHCSNCNAYGPTAGSLAQAVILWNKSYHRVDVLTGLLTRALDKLRIALDIPEYSENYPADMEYYALNQEARKFIRELSTRGGE